jgi:hypothetical protein
MAMAMAHLSQALVFAVYFRLMIVSTTLTSKELDVLDVVGGGGVGSDLPVVGISPARIEVDSAHTNTTAIANFFMVSFLAPLYVQKDATILT